MAERRIHAAPHAAVLFVYDPDTTTPLPEAAADGLIVVVPATAPDVVDQVKAFFVEFASLNRFKLPPSLQ